MDPFTQIILTIRAGIDLAVYGLGVIERAQQEKRDPTPEEVADVKQRQAAALARWDALAPEGDK